jgi:hypothetical protein
LPLARSPKRRSTPAVGVQHVPLAIGYYDSAPSTLVSDFNHLSKKSAMDRIFVDPLLAYKKSSSNTETVHAASDNRDDGNGIIDSRDDLVNGSRLLGRSIITTELIKSRIFEVNARFKPPLGLRVGPRCKKRCTVGVQTDLPTAQKSAGILGSGATAGTK